jgi:hypothetical protein
LPLPAWESLRKAKKKPALPKTKSRRPPVTTSKKSSSGLQSSPDPGSGFRSFSFFTPYLVIFYYQEAGLNDYKLPGTRYQVSSTSIRRRSSPLGIGGSGGNSDGTVVTDFTKAAKR